MLGIYSNISNGLEYTITPAATLEYSDNALLTASQKRSDTEQRAAITVTLEENSRHIQLTADYRAQHSDYINNTQDEETILEGQANLRWSPLPTTFNWDFFTSTRNLRRDRRDADIINNREKRTIVSTGPVFGLRLSGVDTVQLSGRYTTTELEDSSQGDNERASGRIDWIHDLSSTHKLSAGLEYANTDFDQNLLPDIKNSSTYISYSSVLSNSRFRIKTGYNESKRDSMDTVSGPLVEASFEYNPAGQKISFIAVNLITDSTTGLGNNPGLINDSINVDDANFNTIDVVERLFSELRYTNEALCNSCSISATITYDDQDFDMQPRDEVSLDVGVDAQYRHSSTINTGLSLNRESIDFNDSNRSDDINTVRIRAEYLASRAITLYAWLSTEERQSTNSGSEYDELSGAIGIRYRFQ